MSVGKKIKSLREEKGLSQSELAKAVGYKTRSSITKIESGESDPSQKMLLKIANALEVSPSELIDDSCIVTINSIPVLQQRALSMVKNNPWDPVHLDKTYVKIDDDDVRTFAIGVNEMPPEKKALLLNMARLMFSDFDTYVKKGLAKNVDDDA